MTERQVVAVVGIIRKGDKILMTRRHVKSKFAPLSWQFPGGKVEMFEDPILALERKMKKSGNGWIKMKLKIL